MDKPWMFAGDLRQSEPLGLLRSYTDLGSKLGVDDKEAAHIWPWYGDCRPPCDSGDYIEEEPCLRRAISCAIV